jgi:hypothetical protein
MPSINYLSSSLQNLTTETDQLRRQKSADDLSFRGEVSSSNRAQVHPSHAAHVRFASEGSQSVGDDFRTKENRAALPPDEMMAPTLLDATRIGTVVAAPAAPPRQYPLKDFFRNTDQGFFRLSDDGAMLSFMRPVSVDGQLPRMNIFVQSLQGTAPMGEPRQITSETARDISDYYWKGSSTILYDRDVGGDESSTCWL